MAIESLQPGGLLDVGHLDGASQEFFIMATATAIGTRFKTGEVCGTSGVYAWDGYLDGTRSPSPTAREMEEPIAEGNRFPPIRSCNKACWWKLIRYA